MQDITVPSRHSAPRSHRLPSRQLLVFAFVLVLAIVGIGVSAAYYLRQKEIDSHTRNLDNLSMLVTERIEKTLVPATLILDAIENRVRQQKGVSAQNFAAVMGTREMHDFMRYVIEGVDAIDVATVATTDGQVCNFTRAYPPPAIYVGDRDYFLAAMRRNIPGNFLSTPVRNRSNGTWNLYISRRLVDGRGNALGVALVGISIRNINAFLNAVVGHLGSSAAVLLYRDDLTLLTSAPFDESKIGTVNNYGNSYDTIRLRHLDSSITLSERKRLSTGKAELHLSAVRRLSRFPAVVTVAIGEDMLLGNWRRNSYWIANISMVSVLAIGFGTLVLHRNLRRHEATERELHISEAKVHTMLDLTTDWEFWVLPDGAIHYMTPSAQAITGYGTEQFLAHPPLLESIIQPEDLQRLRALGIAPLPDGQPVQENKADVRLVRADGVSIWVNYRCRPVASAGQAAAGRRIAVRDITDRKSDEEKIRTLAFFDSLTGLPNRFAIQERIAQAIARARQQGSRFSVSFIDLDRFKQVNDNQGHGAGDMVLREMADRIRRSVSASDTVARLGGDEFLVLMEDLRDQSACSQLASTLIAVIARPLALQGQWVTLGASVGIAYYPEHGADGTQLMKHADIALYEAKARGRQGYCIFDSDMLAREQSRRAMELALAQAIAQGTLSLHYQAQIGLQTNAVTGVEALLRWRHGEQLVPPNEFIPVAERAGLIPAIGRWVLETALAQQAAWSRQGLHIPVAVNISALQLERADFSSHIEALLAHHGTAPRLLELELTESQMMLNPDLAERHLTRLRQLGVRVAIDDFGTGYSSLGSLRDLPCDVLKVDRLFIASDDPHTIQILKIIAELGHTFGLALVAEGIETESQAEMLRALGYETGQGYLFAHPLAADQFEAWLGTRLA